MIQYFDFSDTAGRVLVVGDIHGCFSQLEEELKNIGFDRNTDTLLSVGDLVDRGFESEKVIDYLSEPWFYAIRGNHEQMAIDYFNGGEAGHYVRNGGRWFTELTRSRQAIYATEYFEKLPFVFSVKTKKYNKVGIVHAACLYDDWDKVESYLSNNSRNTNINKDFLWDRTKLNRFDDTIIANVDLVIHGHTTVKSQYQLGNSLYIDTGAVFGNKLTIVEI